MVTTYLILLKKRAFEAAWSQLPSDERLDLVRNWSLARFVQGCEWRAMSLAQGGLASRSTSVSRMLLATPGMGTTRTLLHIAQRLGFVNKILPIYCDASRAPLTPSQAIWLARAIRGESIDMSVNGATTHLLPFFLYDKFDCKPENHYFVCEQAHARPIVEEIYAIATSFQCQSLIAIAGSSAWLPQLVTGRMGEYTRFPAAEHVKQNINSSKMPKEYLLPFTSKDALRSLIRALSPTIEHDTELLKAILWFTTGVPRDVENILMFVLEASSNSRNRLVSQIMDAVIHENVMVPVDRQVLRAIAKHNEITPTTDPAIFDPFTLQPIPRFELLKAIHPLQISLEDLLDKGILIRHEMAGYMARHPLQLLSVYGPMAVRIVRTFVEKFACKMECLKYK